MPRQGNVAKMVFYLGELYSVMIILLVCYVVVVLYSI